MPSINSIVVPLLPGLVALLAALAACGEAAITSDKDPQPAMMAIRVHAYGGGAVLRHEQVARPSPGRGEILVRVHAAGVNPVDVAVRGGGMADVVKVRLPHGLGYDVSGTVVEVGEGAGRFTPGDEVFAFMHLSRPGAYAEYVIVRENEAAAKPQNLSHRDAAGVPLVALTAWQALFDKADLQEGQTVLIHAGAGGVGTMAIQLAKWRGARVIATASQRNHEFLLELGADEVIDYTTERFEERVRNVDVVLDPIGRDTQERSWQVLRRGGTLVSIIQPPNRETARRHGVRATWFLVEPNAQQLAEISRLLEEGAIRPITTHVLPLEKAAEAHAQSETRRTRGKIVLEVIPDDAAAAERGEER